MLEPIAYTRISESRPGPTVVLIPGLTEVQAVWSPVIDCLRPDFNVIAVDNRGSGQSPPLTRRWSISLFARDIVDVLRSLEIDQVIAIGNSMGGAIAQQLAVMHPTKVKGLVLLSTCARADGLLRFILTTWLEAAAVTASIDDVIRWTYAFGYGRQFFNAHEREILRELRAMPSHMTTESFVASCEALTRHDTRNGLQTLEIPALILHGADDSLIPAGLGADLARLIGESEFRLIPNAGHALLSEAPAALAQHIQSFLVSVEHDDPKSVTSAETV